MDDRTTYYIDALREIKTVSAAAGYSGEVEAIDAAIEALEATEWLRDYSEGPKWVVPSIQRAIKYIKQAEACTLDLATKEKLDVLHRLISIEQELIEIADGIGSH